MKLKKHSKYLPEFWILYKIKKIKVDFYSPHKSTFILLFSLFILFFLYDFDKISFLRPQSVHQWRQCDCLSFTQNYYQEDISFWEPQINYLGEDNTGKTVSDFPIIYYGIGKLWKLTGPKEYIYRFILLLISFLGIIALHKTIESILKSSFWGLIISLLLFSSTIFVYYSNNFLMNAPAFSFALMGLYFFYKYTQKQKQSTLILSLILFLFGGLLKIQALTSLVALIALFTLDQSSIVKFKQKIFKHKWLSLILFSILLIIVFLWYYYAYQYNLKHNKGIFLIGILPIWDYSFEQIKHVINYAYILWSNSYQSKLVQIIAIILFIYIIYNQKKLPLAYTYFLFFLFVGFLMYITLWFQVFDNHDYYMINQLLLMQVIFLTSLMITKITYPKIYKSKLLQILALGILLYNINVCSKNIHTRYYGWPNDKHKKQTQAFENIEPYLNKIGVKKTDKVIVQHDASFNISLYLMNRKGFTNSLNQLKDSAEMEEKIKKGAKYLIINDSNLLNKNYIIPFIQKPVGKYKNIYIFKLGQN